MLTPYGLACCKAPVWRLSLALAGGQCPMKPAPSGGNALLKYRYNLQKKIQLKRVFDKIIDEFFL